MITEFILKRVDKIMFLIRAHLPRSWLSCSEPRPLRRSFCRNPRSVVFEEERCRTSSQRRPLDPDPRPSGSHVPASSVGDRGVGAPLQHLPRVTDKDVKEMEKLKTRGAHFLAFWWVESSQRECHVMRCHGNEICACVPICNARACWRHWLSNM